MTSTRCCELRSRKHDIADEASRYCFDIRGNAGWKLFAFSIRAKLFLKKNDFFSVSIARRATTFFDKLFRLEALPKKVSPRSTWNVELCDIMLMQSNDRDFWRYRNLRQPLILISDNFSGHVQRPAVTQQFFSDCQFALPALMEVHRYTQRYEID